MAAERPPHDPDRPAMEPPMDATSTSAPAGRVRERRLSSSPSVGAAADVGAPVVWTTPDWAAHPVIENFYGHARRERHNSFFEVMQSPTNTLATCTLAESCNNYALHDSDGEASEDADDDRGRPTRKLGSFSYSYTTETSDEIVGASPSFSTSTVASADDVPRVHASALAADRRRASTSAVPFHGGYAHWSRQRLPSDLVPVPHSAGRLTKPTLDAVRSAPANPQCGPADSPSSNASSSGQNPESPTRVRRPGGLTSGRLRTKLQDCVMQIDERIGVEVALARDAYASMRRAAQAPRRESPSLMWALLCGVGASAAGARGARPSLDGLDFLHERLAIARHHRALNQLQRHRRHVNGILQIVTSHNPDLGLTEKQLDSFESADAMLANDVKYSMLQKQVEALATTRRKRQDALRHARGKHGRECFDSPRLKNAMLAKLLEAVSWYRLVQTNSRDESASSSVGLSVDGAQPTHEASLASGASGASGSSSSISASRSLQELQVERILSVLAGEEFYSDYNELMCQPDWWEIAQAHFENIIFSKAESRVCQWVLRVSKEVAAVSYEGLEEESSFRLEDRRALQHGNSKFHNPAAVEAAQPHAEWTKDPQPEQILEFVDRVTRRIRKEFDVPNEVTKSLNAFVQRMVFPRLGLLCFNNKTIIDTQRKDKLWRKQCVDLSGIPLENLGVTADLAGKIRSKLPFRRVAGGRKAYLIRAIDAFNCMTSVVPCDLLDELMYGVVILHHEAALVLGTTQFSVETFFPLLTYVLLHCQLPTIHAQLHMLENYAITTTNANGEESYYVYCVHAAVEYVCNSAGLTTTPPAPPMPSTKKEDFKSDAVSSHVHSVETSRADLSSAVVVAAPV